MPASSTTRMQRPMMSLRRIAGNFRTKIVQAERKSKRSLRFCRGAAYLGGASARQSVQAERKSKRSLRFCRGAAYLSGACSRKACKPSAKANEVCGFAEAAPVWAGLRPARSAVRVVGDTRNGGRDTNASRSARNAVGRGCPAAFPCRFLCSGTQMRRTATLFCEFSVFFLRFWKKELLLHSGKSYTTSSCRIPQARN